MGVGGGFVFMGFAPIALAMPPPRLNNSIKKERNNDSLRKILVLMTNTGGGHKASAQAIKAGFQEVYNDKYDISIVDDDDSRRVTQFPEVDDKTPCTFMNT
eukprot:TRINITY_DN10731_c0_g2_i6.p3 TRINITY_DN10731_c0_g2~~TRINITY_DN10731_c0_g2_i6.p3  ORF type:complete len:117 (-),score=17.24 TRINITY_DN10731_c0_g2_i6:1270-1572(-)